MNDDEFDTAIPRDRWGRPMVVPPRGGKPVPYTRTTTFVSCLEDVTALTKWKQRMVALGLADRPDLMLSVAAHRDNRKQLDTIAADALEAARAGAAATTGTALHALTERMDRGLPLGVIPEAYKADLDAYAAATHVMSYAGIEQFRVYDAFEIGGTADRVVDFGDRLAISDIKTGNIEYGLGKIAMQLAVYARAVPYDHRHGKRIPDAKPMDLERALITHLPAGTGQCTLYWVDIAAGWRGVQLAADVRSWRRTKGLSRLVDPSELAPCPEASLLEQVDDFTDLEVLRAWYVQLDRAGRGTEELLIACTARAAQLQARAAS